MRNEIVFKVYGPYALFSDPINRVGGEKFSYQIPTGQALIGVCESIYWKPTFRWIIDEVRILKIIRTQRQGIRPISYIATYSDKGNTLSYYTYLMDVAYEVKAHFEWNLQRPDLETDRDEHKHHNIARRMLEKGGRRDIFLGTRECQGYAEPVVFGEAPGAYDEYSTIYFDNMFYRYDYPGNTGGNELIALFWRPVMKNGIIRFNEAEAQCTSKIIKVMAAKKPATNGLDEFEGEAI